MKKAKKVSKSKGVEKAVSGAAGDAPKAAKGEAKGSPA
jgi:hypothetical protein